MKKWALSIGLGFVLFLIFLLLSFPWSRLGPRLSTEVAEFLSQNLRDQYSCRVESFGIALPFGMKMDEFSCRNSANNELFQFEDVSVTLLPFLQSIRAKVGDGQLSLNTNAGFSGEVSRLKANLESVALSRLAPLLFAANSLFSFSAPVNLEVEGSLSGTLDIPLKNLHQESGKVELAFEQLRLPSQLYLDLIGLRELRINPAIVNIELNKGELVFTDTAMISPDLAGKIEGRMQLEEPLVNSAGDLQLKWKVQRSDALLSSPIGSQLLNTPCPSPDAQGFCTRRISRLSELQNLLRPGGF